MIRAGHPVDTPAEHLEVCVGPGNFTGDAPCCVEAWRNLPQPPVAKGGED